MIPTSTAGLAATWATTNAAVTQQTLTTAMVKQQAESERLVVDLLATALEAVPVSQLAAPPPGQGQYVDRLA